MKAITVVVKVHCSDVIISYANPVLFYLPLMDNIDKISRSF